ncbi:MAG: fibronectin type III domain-containing protein, partial [Acidimicrobiaceae bacterium]|nr:fibronectin type III domain-containing protein [Acidimicrobiaceae bacterium]
MRLLSLSWRFKMILCRAVSGSRQASSVRLLVAVAVMGLVVSGLSVVSPQPAGAQTQSVVEVREDWALIPSGLGAGDEFRLLFVTNTPWRDASSSDIADYDTFVQNKVAAGHTAIREHRSSFKVVGSTASVDARDHVEATGTGVPIYWMNGAKVADGYADFWDGSWNANATGDRRSASGTASDSQTASDWVWTGTNDDGTKHANPLGSTNVRRGAFDSDSPLSHNTDPATHTHAFYGLSPVFRVELPEVPFDSRPSYSQVFEGERKAIVFEVPGATVDFSVSRQGDLSSGDYRIYYPHDATTPLSESSWKATASNGLVKFGLEAVADGVSGESGEVLRVSLTTDMDQSGTADIEIADGQRRLGLLFRVSHNGEWVETDRPVVTLHEGGQMRSYQYKSTHTDDERYSSAMHLRIQRGKGSARSLFSIGPGPRDIDRFEFADSPPHTPAAYTVPYLSVTEVDLGEWQTVNLQAGHDDDAFGHGFSLTHEVSFWPEKVKTGTWTILGQTLNTYVYAPGRFSEHSEVAVRIVDDDKWEQELVYARHDPDANGGSGGPDGEWVLASDKGLRDALPTALAPGSEYTFYIRLAVDPATLPKDGNVSRDQTHTYVENGQQRTKQVDLYPSTFLPDRIPVWVDIPGYNNNHGIADVRLSITPQPGRSVAAAPNSGGLFLVDTSGQRDHPSVEADYDYKDNFSADKGGLFWDEPLKVTIIVADDAPTGVTRRLSVHSDSGLLTRPGGGRGWSRVDNINSMSGEPGARTDKTEEFTYSGDYSGYYFWDGFDIDIAEVEDLEPRKQRQMSAEEFNPRTPEEILEYVKQVNAGNEGEDVPFVPFADVNALSDEVMEGETAQFEVTLIPAPEKTRAVTVNITRRAGKTPPGLEAHLGVRTIMVGPTGRALLGIPTADNEDPGDNGDLYVTVVSNPIYRISDFGGAAEVVVRNDEPGTGHDAVRVRRVTDTTAEIEWDPTPGATSYEVVWIEGTSTTTDTVVTTAASVELTGLRPNADYNLAVLDDFWNRVGSAEFDTLEPGGGPKTYPVLSIAAGPDIDEGSDAVFTLTADPTPTSPLTVPVWVSQNGDYAATGERGERSVTIGTGGSLSFTVATADDQADEADGVIIAALEGGQPNHIVGLNHRASVAVADNDDGTTPEISIRAAGPVVEGSNAVFTVTADPAPTAPLTVNVNVSQDGDWGVSTGSQTVTIGTTGSATLTVAT